MKILVDVLERSRRTKKRKNYSNSKLVHNIYLYYFRLFSPKKDAKKAQQPKKSALKNSPAAQTPKSDKSETKSDAGTPELSKNQKKKLAKKQKQEASGADDKPKVNGNATEKKRPNESSGEAKHAKKVRK